ncbi:hypothetical protein GQ607_011643 [Colletotrichum asianum]|uniref:Uncharacterized protein n=1 Tax=Colletotrichum asianum TaxID=702518 RepID=A0A8H3W8C7_9PEZI|nr:hypothetical protein GQ607_011643 [Colletotrichum asianum]
MARDAVGALAISNIPSIAILRERLNYGNKTTESCKRLLSSIKLFHSTFKTHDGRAASEIGWNEPNKSVLNEVVESFLDAAGNGPNFWPNDENSPNFNGLCYSNHEHKERCEHRFWFQQWMVKMTWHYKMNENRQKRKLETSNSQAEPISNVESSNDEACSNRNSVRMTSEPSMTNQVSLAPTPLVSNTATEGSCAIEGGINSNLLQNPSQRGICQAFIGDVSQNAIFAESDGSPTRQKLRSSIDARERHNVLLGATPTNCQENSNKPRLRSQRNTGIRRSDNAASAMAEAPRLMLVIDLTASDDDEPYIVNTPVVKQEVLQKSPRAIHGHHSDLIASVAQASVENPAPVLWPSQVCHFALPQAPAFGVDQFWPRVNVTLKYIASRYPTWNVQTWKPRLRFSQCSLQQLRNELRIPNSERIGFKLQLAYPGLFYTSEVAGHDEIMFRQIREQMIATIRRELWDAGSLHPLDIFVVIESVHDAQSHPLTAVTAPINWDQSPDESLLAGL